MTRPGSLPAKVALLPSRYPSGRVLSNKIRVNYLKAKVQRVGGWDSDGSIAIKFGCTKTVRGADLQNISAVPRILRNWGFVTEKFS